MRVPSSSTTRYGIQFALLFSLFMTALVVFQQQRTIESQRVLIRDLFQDSMQLNGMKMAALSTRIDPAAHRASKR